LTKLIASVDFKAAPAFAALWGGMALAATIASWRTAAMAAYQANNPGFNPATATSMPTDPTLRSALAAAWHS